MYGFFGPSFVYSVACMNIFAMRRAVDAFARPRLPNAWWILSVHKWPHLEFKKLGFLQWNSDIGLFKSLVNYFSYNLVKDFISEGYLLWFLAISWVEKASLVALSVYPPPSVSSLILLPRSSPLPPSPKRLCLFGEIHNSKNLPKHKNQQRIIPILNLNRLYCHVFCRR